MSQLRQLTGDRLSRAIERLRNPAPGSKIAAARDFGVDLTLLIEQIQLSPAERARRMHELAQAAESARGGARRRRSGA
ncbi:MAG: hypothetical protein U0Q16_26280 [Bryobacteraceae bacterium]